MSFKRWQCPTCNRITRSVTSVRERYCVACSRWAEMIEHCDDAKPGTIGDLVARSRAISSSDSDGIEARIRAYAEANGTREEPDGKVWN